MTNYRLNNMIYGCTKRHTHNCVINKFQTRYLELWIIIQVLKTY